MKALLLNGSDANDLTGQRLQQALEAALQARGWQVEPVLLREKKIAPCAGDFFCWVRTPGVCNFDDDNRQIAASIVNSDLVIDLTPVTFGGYSALLKRAVDHLIQNISPYFTRLAGETHHRRRYARYPDFLLAGWQAAPDPQAEGIFRHLAHRNTLNFYARRSVCGVALSTQSDAELRAQADAWLQALEAGAQIPATALPQPPLAPAAAVPPRRAVLLVGSPQGRGSSSHALGSYLMEQLAARSVQTDTILIYPALNQPEKMQALLQTLAEADLAVLAFPLYVDSLPAPCRPCEQRRCVLLPSPIVATRNPIMAWRRWRCVNSLPIRWVVAGLGDCPWGPVRVWCIERQSMNWAAMPSRSDWPWIRLPKLWLRAPPFLAQSRPSGPALLFPLGSTAWWAILAGNPRPKNMPLKNNSSTGRIRNQTGQSDLLPGSLIPSCGGWVSSRMAD